MGSTYPNQKGNDYYRNHTLYHIGTLDPLGLKHRIQASWVFAPIGLATGWKQRSCKDGELLARAETRIQKGPKGLRKIETTI